MMRHNNLQAKQLVGRKIVEVRWMTPEEANESYWDYQPVLLILDDGTALCPMSDDEGNEGSALAVLNNEELSTIPVMRERLWVPNHKDFQI